MLSLALLGACSSTPNDPESEDAGEPQRKLSIPSAERYVESPGDEAERPIQIQVLRAADVGAKDRVDVDLSDQGYDPEKEPVKVELINVWDDASRLYANVNYKNTGGACFKSIYILGYDRLGRLISTNVRQIFFQPKQNFVATESFAKDGLAVRWTLLVKD